MIAEIYERVLPEMKANGIEDTPLNRIACLQGLADAWREDESFDILKPFYQLALTLEIQRLTVQIHSYV
jgi:hypothetical protein